MIETKTLMICGGLQSMLYGNASESKHLVYWQIYQVFINQKIQETLFKAVYMEQRDLWAEDASRIWLHNAKS